MGVVSGVNTVTDGLIFYVDPSNTNSVPGTGTSIYNLTNLTVAGTLVGYTTNPIDNTENESILIDNVSGYVNGPSNIALTNNFTVSVWFKVNVFNTGAIIGKWYAASGNAHRCWIMNTDTPTSSMAIVLSSDGSYTNPTIKRYLVPVNLNEYTHLAFTFASGTLLVYKNGTLATVTKSIDGSFSSVYDNATRAIQLGYFYDFQNYYNSANIGVVQIYNKVLSSTEILQNYNATKSRYNTSDNIVTDGLAFNLDPSKRTSYPGTGTSIYDLSGFGYVGTLVNGATFTNSNSGIISLDGTNDYISFSNAYASGFGISANATISIWAKITTKTAYTSFAGFYNPASGNKSDFGMDITSSNTIRLWKNDTQSDTYYSIIKNNWDNYVITADSSTAKLYVNGDLRSSMNVSGPINNNRMFAIGYNWDVMINASVSQTLIYNRTLSQQEITQNYNATKTRYINTLPPISDSLVLNLDAGNRASYAGTGTTWVDLSSNRISASLVDGVVFAGTGISTHFSFDGTGDYVNIPSTSLFNFGSGDFSVELAIYYNTSTSSDNTYRPAFMLSLIHI